MRGRGRAKSVLSGWCCEEMPGSIINGLIYAELSLISDQMYIGKQRDAKQSTGRQQKPNETLHWL